MRACATLKESHRIGFTSFALALVLSLAPTPVNAAEIYGQITYRDGKPVADKPISLASRPVGNTDASGSYRLSLPPGQYTLIIEGKAIPIVVLPSGVNQNITLP